MSESSYHEKGEKEEEKRDEKSKEEKSWEEKWRRDPLQTIVWALIFIWAGIVLLLDNMQIIDRFFEPQPLIPGLSFLPRMEAWSIILFGAGVIVLAEAVIRLFLPAYRRPVSGTFFIGIILIGISLGNLFNWNILWPLILIALGLSILLRGFSRRQS